LVGILGVALGRRRLIFRYSFAVDRNGAAFRRLTVEDQLVRYGPGDEVVTTLRGRLEGLRSHYGVVRIQGFLFPELLVTDDKVRLRYDPDLLPTFDRACAAAVAAPDAGGVQIDITVTVD
jgi:hypothetical protein